MRRSECSATSDRALRDHSLPGPYGPERTLKPSVHRFVPGWPNARAALARWGGSDEKSTMPT
ncbi:MAG: hypothetical protein ACYDFT_01390, partial [Thermoplasmata archaeon]